MNISDKKNTHTNDKAHCEYVKMVANNEAKLRAKDQKNVRRIENSRNVVFSIDFILLSLIVSIMIFSSFYFNLFDYAQCCLIVTLMNKLLYLFVVLYFIFMSLYLFIVLYFIFISLYLFIALYFIFILLYLIGIFHNVEEKN